MTIHGIAGARVTEFIKLWDDHKGEGYFPGERATFGAWQIQLRDGFVDKGFEHVDIGPEFHSPEPLIVSSRKILWQYLQTMISDTQQEPTLFPAELRDEATGERIYNEMWTADAWLQKQVGNLCCTAILSGMCWYIH